MPVPNTFANATATIPLSQLDANFATTITLGNTAIQLGNTVSTLNNMTLANVTVTSGNVTITNVTVTTANVTTANIATAQIANVTVSGTGTFAAGSNTAPSITTSGDTNTGIFFPAADTIAFTEGGVESMRIDSAGNVGIGTTGNLNYSSRLKVLAPSNGSVAEFYTPGNTYKSRINLTNDFGGAGIGSDSSALVFYANDATTERMRLDASGNLGLGVTPSAWSTTGNYNALQLRNASLYFRGSAAELYVGNNHYYNGTNWIYLQSLAAARYDMENGVHKWYNAPSGTAGNAISFTQVMAVEGGKSLALEGAVSQSGTGITFPATQSASSNANTLDDYEEGNWTPTDASGAGLSFNNVAGRYTKIGRIVFLTATLDYPSTANGSAAVIGGLPFTISDYGGGYSQYTSAAAGAIAFRNSGGLSGGATLLVTNGTNTDAALTNANLSTQVVQLFFFGIV